MLEMSWITAILQLYSQVADLFGNVILKRINIRLVDLLARFHYILNLPRIISIENTMLSLTMLWRRKMFLTKVTCNGHLMIFY